MNSVKREGARLVVFLHSGYSVDVELAKDFGAVFRRHGLDFVDFGYSDPQAPAAFSALLTECLPQIHSFLSLNYYARQFRINGRMLHHATGIPLAIFLADHPLYFLDQQGPDLEGAIVYVPGRDLVDFVARYWPAKTIAVNNQTFLPPPFEHVPPSLENFLGRRNEILCPLNLSIWGRSMDGVWELIRALPPPRRAFTVRLIETLLTDCETPIHEAFAALPESAGERRLEDARLALDFIKIWRRNHMVRALIDLPILVSSEYVPADLQLKYPEKFTLLSMADTLPLYHKFRFVLNSFPLMTYAFHERPIKALHANAVLITDPNNRMRECLTDGSDVIFYDYAAAGNRDRVEALMENPERAYGMTLQAHQALETQPAFKYDSYADLIAVIDRQIGA